MHLRLKGFKGGATKSLSVPIPLSYPQRVENARSQNHLVLKIKDLRVHGSELVRARFSLGFAGRRP